MTRLTLASAFAAILLLSGTGGTNGASSHIGTITAYHLNAGVAGRGPCIQTDPAAPTTWICLYCVSPLYEEMKETLRTADQFGQQCYFEWGTVDQTGYAVLNLLECASLL